MDSRNAYITDTYPLELHSIKALFLQKRYRQVIQACRDILKTAGDGMRDYPLQQTFISFYIGVSHDELARLMHDYSQAKMPAFRQAEQFYNEAIVSLPLPGSILEVEGQAASLLPNDPFTESSPLDPNAYISPSPDEEYDPFNYSSPSLPNLTSSPPPSHYDTGNLPTRSTPVSSRETSSSDLESHSSFDQIMTPHKFLERDISRMSLLDDAHRLASQHAIPKSLERDVSRMSLLDPTRRPNAKPAFPRSTSQGLLKPIRLGSPTQAFHVPPRLPCSGSTMSMSRLPRINTRRAWESPSRNLPSSISEEWSSSPPSPVSPLGISDTVSDASTVSPISPETPVRAMAHGTIRQTPEAHDHGNEDEDEAPDHHSQNLHVRAMRTQLETHLRLLEQETQRTLTAQTKRASERASTAPTTGTPLAPVRGSLDGAGAGISRPSSSGSKHDSVVGESKRLSASRSYWSFTPVDVKAGGLRKRIKEGRERGWARERFGRERTTPRQWGKLHSELVAAASTHYQIIITSTLHTTATATMGGETHRNLTSASSAKYPQLATRPKGKQIHHIYRDRLGQFTNNGQYKHQSLLAKLYDGRLSGDPHVKLQVWHAPDLTRPTFKEATSKENEYVEAKKGDEFGPSWSTHWFRVRFTLPYDWTYKPRVELHWDANNEGMVWTEDGDALQGLTGGGERVEWVIPQRFRDYDKEHTIYIEMACNGMFGNPTGGDTIQPPDPDRHFKLEEADLVSVNLDARALFYDFWIIGDAAREFPEDSWQEHQALQVCNEIMDCFIAGEGSRSCIQDCRDIAKKYLGNDVDSEKVYEKDPEHAIVNAVGNCHIDTCWLWPWAETKRKIARSWANQCDLLDRYPEHRFVASQAQQFKWLEQLYPSVWDRVKSHIKKGNFQTIGGSWVEHDTNMPSGESLVRQFLYGQRFFESRFGERCKTFWLPDTFGYSTQLPQLCRLAGMKRFFTQKLSWNNINTFPHTTFNWVALDGSQVICHMAPCETYTAEAHFGDVSRSVSQHKSMDQDATSLLPFGKGDGGGGPTFGMLEKLRRCRGVSNTVGLLPKVRIAESVEEFFDGLETRCAEGEVELVTWYGELYFELHRGTYTTQANNKKNNRRAEILLHEIEYLATLATVQGGAKGSGGGDGKKGYRYPKKEIDTMWEGVLLCQFHDCLPGSAIEMCYRDSDELYAKIFKTGKKVMEDVLSALGFEDEDAEGGKGSEEVMLQTLGWEREVPATGIAIAQHDRARVTQTKDNVFVLSNGQLNVEVTDGAITSLYDKKAKREIVPKGQKANQLVIFDDKPLYWQAWDVEVFHLQSRKELPANPHSTKITTNTPELVSLETTTRISSQSWIKTTLSLSASSPSSASNPSYLECSAEIEWRETMKFLKVEFPTTLTSPSLASYETQFGIIRRPTHYNTSWEMAQFEVCCHKWADLSEHNYGVSILNDGKYGFATAGGVMRLSLLRAPKAPDGHADMGRHFVKWAVLPHAGGLDERVVTRGMEFNVPVRVRRHGDAEGVRGLMGAFKMGEGSDGGLVVDTVKRAEDDGDAGNGELAVRRGRHVVVRVYDCLGGVGRGRVVFGPVEVVRAWKCSLLEDELEEVVVGDGGMEIELRAFEVASYKLLLA
ncbi:Glycoside hydrolase, 38 vacuolar alpha mannosidase [Friedmanniomyces endolithicus]|uniref:Alpha-mannosidase n=1 Tax=Friedmanniomyces endolithicus TaxID=329885 RepID=A0AAN6QNE5_9PEZI|nr:Glycoside hydrolase, 38 vacuolar alpha mannosidase [Friedmanniomyces endolithicus]KAK0959358.1 Glycoside hydrolase, 38 vacuolar alpha mannosidase [Friedmanniomyces endolithicus]KAK0974358.1 Glycoside hydrolase, 38 vacuolar alpha mannosidase [Friedmanniomyces endolithicus]KAK1025811.1 Glycoside hydrolase, 38 vacuolar alpha mannosidase [Friedmanniomyces endolithicus]